MKTTARLIALFVVIGLGQASAQKIVHESADLKIIQLSEHIYQHISYLQTDQYGAVPCNGMGYLRGKEAVIFDTPVDDKASVELIDWLGDKTIFGVVVTHFHIDCLGGLKAFHDRGILSYSHHSTISLATEDGAVCPQIGFERQMNFRVSGKNIIVRHFGSGHTSDNVVGYVPSEETLFGGCLIKAMHAGKGNLADAKVDEWSTTVTLIKAEYPYLQLVIPEHGNSGGIELLDYTIQMFTKN
jgi:metallo-beta-lactamase class B